MSSVQGRRGRKVTARQRNPLVIFYLSVGALIIVGAAFLITYAIGGGFGGGQVSAVNAPIGQTAEGFYYKGNPDAAVTVIAYEDYQCPACAFYNRNLGPIIDRDYIETGRVQFVYHEFPLDIHPNAVPASEAARCAGDQGQYWQMHDMLFMNQDQWAQLGSPTNVFSGYAGQLGLNRATFDACMSAGTHRAAIVAAGEAAIAAGIPATPTFIVNGQQVTSTGLPGAIEAALRAAGQ